MTFVVRDPISFAGRALGAFEKAVLAVDTSGALRYASPTAASLLGREIDDFLGSSVEDVLELPASVAGTADIKKIHPVLACLRDGRARSYQEGVVEPGGNGGRSVSYETASVMLDGRVAGALVVINDPCVPQRATADSVNAQKLEGLGRIAAGVAHEINTPTQYVTDNVHFLQDAFGVLGDLVRTGQRIVECSRRGAAVDAAIDELAAKAEQTGLGDLEREIPEALTQTLDGLGRIARIAGALREFLHPVSDEKTAADLNRAIENAVAVCRNEWRYVAEVDLDLDKALPGVTCWIHEFSQVVLNLVTNAAHAIADKMAGKPGELGKIKITTRKRGECAEIKVSDTGTGIPAELLHVVFAPFFTTKKAGRGTGQGLALARSVVVEKHNGSIDVESEVGQGTTFTILLPLRENPAETTPEHVKRRTGGLVR